MVKKIIDNNNLSEEKKDKFIKNLNSFLEATINYQNKNDQVSKNLYKKQMILLN
jgi:hypothetical protein